MVVVPPGRTLIFLAGQAASTETGEIHGKDVHSQAWQTFRNIAAILSDCDGSPGDIVQMTIYVVDFRPEHLAMIEAAGDEIFGSGWPSTASTLVGCQALGAPELLIEITAVLSVPA